MLKDPAEGALVAWMHDVQSSCQVKELVLISAAYIFCEIQIYTFRHVVSVVGDPGSDGNLNGRL